MMGSWRLLGTAVLLVILVIGGSVNGASAQEPPPSPGDLCSGQFNPKINYCLQLGYTAVGNGSSINEICKAHMDCVLNECIRPECVWIATPCEYDFFRECGERFFDDGMTALICTVMTFYQNKRIEIHPEYPEDCDGDPIMSCPSGECRGCREEYDAQGNKTGKGKSWCGCSRSRVGDRQGSLECPANECCSHGLIPFEVCGRIDSGYDGWGRCYDFGRNVYTHCGFKGGYSIVDINPFYADVCEPIERPLTGQMCGWYDYTTPTHGGIMGVDHILDYVYDGGPAYNPKYSCHYCKGNTYLEAIPTNEDCDQSGL